MASLWRGIKPIDLDLRTGKDWGRRDELTPFRIIVNYLQPAEHSEELPQEQLWTECSKTYRPDTLY